MANDGGYKARNGAKDAPMLRNKSGVDDINIGDDFPILCETCLGPNPYVRMVKMPYGQKLCKISNSPYQAFRWKAGPGGRYKETIVSYVVAKERNICQTCLNDLQFGVPVGVRDKLLSQSGNSTQLTLPQSEVGTAYFYEQQARLEDGPQPGVAQGREDLAPSRQLLKFSRTLQVAESHNKTAFRNLPKLCSFWVGGQCLRVLKKSCPFRPCCGTFLFPEIAGAQKGMCAELISSLQKDGPAVVMKTLANEVRIALKGAGQGNREDAIKKRVTGEDDLSKAYLNKMKAMNLELPPAEDPSVTTLWVGNLAADTTESDLYNLFFPSGPVAGIHIVHSARCAFIEMGTRAAAESAAKELYGALLLRGRSLNLHWARPRISAGERSVLEGEEGGRGRGRGREDEGETGMLAPPGLESIPVSSYALPVSPPPAGTDPPASVSGRREREGEGEREREREKCLKICYKTLRHSRHRYRL
mmetsp:Transcript_15645/g.15765  ORF Transcript_15645/g.15765 Transcript_15645/m.15765 type:complete len:473 (+) Transcript_15645:136-1554(+)